MADRSPMGYAPFDEVLRHLRELMKAGIAEARFSLALDERGRVEVKFTCYEKGYARQHNVGQSEDGLELAEVLFPKLRYTMDKAADQMRRYLADPEKRHGG